MELRQCTAARAPVQATVRAPPARILKRSVAVGAISVSRRGPVARTGLVINSDMEFTKGELMPYGPIELNPGAAVLNYGQGLLEGLRAHRKEDGLIPQFRSDGLIL
ncbi:hypothetical protein ABZP36_007632 [Zizania latifolia]